MAKCESCRGTGNRAPIFGYTPKCVSCGGTGVEPPKFKDFMADIKQAIKSSVPREGIVIRPTFSYLSTLTADQAMEHMYGGGLVYREVRTGRFYYKIKYGTLLCRHNECGGWNDSVVPRLNHYDVFYVAQRESETERWFAYKAVPADASATIGRAMQDHKEPCKFKINMDGVEEACARLREAIRGLDVPVYLVCSDCGGQGRYPISFPSCDAEWKTCARCQGTGKIKVENKEKIMLTQQEYDIGRNPGMKPWCFLDEATKSIIRSVKQQDYVEFLQDCGNWSGRSGSDEHRAGWVYRLKDTAPRLRIGKVEPKELKGFDLEYTACGQAWLYVGPSTNCSAITAKDLASILDSTGHSVLANSFRKLEEMNRSV